MRGTSLPESNPLLPSSSYQDRADLPEDLRTKLESIELILSDSGSIPVDTLRFACKATMQCIRANPETILALEPEDQQLVVQGYLALTDKATQNILNPKKKQSRKKRLKELESNPLAEEDEEF